MDPCVRSMPQKGQQNLHSLAKYFSPSFLPVVRSAAGYDVTMADLSPHNLRLGQKDILMTITHFSYSLLIWP
jgi:hypothetical protein